MKTPQETARRWEELEARPWFREEQAEVTAYVIALRNSLKECASFVGCHDSLTDDDIDMIVSHARSLTVDTWLDELTSESERLGMYEKKETT